MKLLYLSSIMKDKTWKYEDEYRILYLNKGRVSREVTLIDELGLKIFKIFIGINCDVRYKEKLKEISKSLKCELFEMFFGEDIDCLKLGHRKLHLQ